jgi:hypothetical protein
MSRLARPFHSREMKSRIVQRAIFFAIAFVLIAVGLLPKLRAGISDSALFIGLSAIFLGAGVWQLTTAAKFADAISQEMVDASAPRRLWLPAVCYNRPILRWMFRLSSRLVTLTSSHQSMERTADRCASAFEMICTLPLRATRLLARPHRYANARRATLFPA